MTSLVAIGAGALVVVALVIVGLKMARRGGEDLGESRGQSKRLAESAARRARADAIAARPIPNKAKLVPLWRRYRRIRGVQDDPESGGPAPTVPPAE